MSKKLKKRPLIDNDNDDDNDDNNNNYNDDTISVQSSASDSEEPTSIPHAKRAVKALMDTPVAFEKSGLQSYFEDDSLRKRRETKGYYADDGLPIPRGTAKDSAYGVNYIDEKLIRLKMLDANPYYRFIRQVAGGKILETLLDESVISAETNERVKLAKAHLERQQQRSQDSGPEQGRVKDLRTQADNAAKEFEQMQVLQQQYEAARNAFRANFERLNQRKIDIEDVQANYISVFDYFTRVAVARYHAGGYRRTMIEARAIAELLHSATMEKERTNNVDKESRRVRLVAGMPTVSFAALLWSALYIVSQNSILLESVRDCASKQFPETSIYAKANTGANSYADDLVALANLVFDNRSTENKRYGTEDILTMSQISQYLWVHINKMIERSGSEQQPLSRPTQPTPPTEQRAKSKLVSGIIVKFEVSDEDARTAAGGFDVIGVSQELLAEARAKLYTNTDSARSLAIIIELLTPMMNCAYPHMFYTNENQFDDGRDEEAFAGGHYPQGRSLEVFSQSDKDNPSHLAFVALFAISNYIVQNSILATPTVKENANKMLNDQTQIGQLKQKVSIIMTKSKDVYDGYIKAVVNRMLRTHEVVDAFAQYALLGDRTEAITELTRSEIAQLKQYVDISQTFDHGSTRSKEFVTAENAAANVLANSKPIATNLSTAGISKLTQHPTALTLSHRYFYANAGANVRQSEARFEEKKAQQKLRADELKEEAFLLNERMQAWVKMTKEESASRLEDILRSESNAQFLPTAKVALQPINSGVMILTTLAFSAVNDSYDKIIEFIPCISETYTQVEDLMIDDRYYVRFARLVRVQLRITDTEEGDQYYPDKTESRTRLSRASALNSLRALARDDPVVQHLLETHRCTCYGFDNGLPSAITGNAGLFGGAHSVTVRSVSRGL